MQLAQLPPTEVPAANPAEPDGNAVAQTDPADDTQVGAVPEDGDFSGMTIAELLQLDLVLPQGAPADDAAVQSAGNDTETVDLTELSLLELMNLRATPTAQPDLPDLAPTAEKLQLNDAGLDQGLPSHLSPDGGLTPIGVLPGTSFQPPPPPPPPAPPPEINVAPDALNVTRSGSEDSLIPITLRGVDSDGALSFVTLSSLPANGTLYTSPSMTVPATVGTDYPTSAGGHTFYFQPAANFNGTVTFQFTVIDNTGFADLTPATATIVVNPANDAPDAVADAYSIDEDSVLTVGVTGVLSNDTDADTGDTLHVSLVNGKAADGTPITLASGALLTLLSDGSYVYDPNGNFDYLAAGKSATDSFTYTASDGHGGTDKATVTITVTGVNDAPVATNDSNASDPVVEDKDATASGNVLANDVDPDSTLTVTTAGTFVGIYGSLTIDAAGNYTYTLDNTDPDTNALDFGDMVTDTFGYTTSDGLASASANLVITISGRNDVPVAVADANGGDPVVEDSDSKAAGNVLANDVDPDDALTVTSFGIIAGTYGSLTINADGSYTYTLDNADPDTNALAAGKTATDTFSYTVSDGTATATANLVITITGANDPPVAADDVNSLDAVVEDKDAGATGNVLTNDTDVDTGDVLTVSSAGIMAGTYGSLVLAANGSWTYSLDDGNPNTDALAKGQTVTETFGYTVSDGQGGTDTANLVITITGSNDAPTDITLSGATVAENDDGAVIGKLTAIDPDAGDTHSFSVSDGRFEVAGDQLQLKAGNSLDFETEPTLSIDVTATDKDGLDHTKSFLITVTDVAGQSLTGDGGANLLTAGAENDTLSGLAGDDTLVGGGGADVLSGGANDDTLTWDPADVTVNGGTGTDTLLVTSGNLDLGAAGALSAIEKVDLGTGNGNSTLTLTAADVISVSDTNTLTVTGDAGDSLDAGKGWIGGLPDGFGNIIYTQLVGLTLTTLVVDASVTTNPDILSP